MASARTHTHVRTACTHTLLDEFLLNHADAAAAGHVTRSLWQLGFITSPPGFSITHVRDETVRPPLFLSQSVHPHQGNFTSDITSCQLTFCVRTPQFYRCVQNAGECGSSKVLSGLCWPGKTQRELNRVFNHEHPNKPTIHLRINTTVIRHIFLLFFCCFLLYF